MKNGDKIFKRVIIFASVISAAVIFLYIFQFAKEPLSTSNGAWGQFGDYVGGTLNPVFGFLSLVILLYVLRQNERALQMSKEELELTRQELRDSATALAEQSETMKIQRFEQTFFSLLRLYSDIVSDFSDSDGSYDYEAKEALGRVLRDLSKIKNKYTKKEEFDTQYNKFNKQYSWLLGHYFRTIYNILKFIDNSNIGNSNKKVYANFLRAQLSTDELTLLFYNSISTVGREKMLPLMLKYDVLQHIDFELLYNKEIDLQIFEELKKSIE